MTTPTVTSPRTRARRHWLTCEVLALLRSRALLALLGLVFATGVAFQLSRVSAFAYASERFAAGLADSARNGETLAQALGREVVILQDGSNRLVENSLRLEYEQAVTAWRALRPGPGPLLESAALAFVLLTAVACGVAIAPAVADRRSGLLKLRLARLGHARLAAAKVAEVAAAVGALVLAAVAGGQAGALVTARLVDPAGVPDVIRAAAPVLPGSTVLAALGLALAALAWAGLFGLGLGLLTGEVAATGGLTAVLLLTVPLLGPWDPRNALAHLAEPAFTFLPTTTVQSAFASTPTLDALVLAAWTLGPLAAGYARFRLRSGYTQRRA